MTASLILFDIDHTLIDVAALHDPAYEAAVLEAHGVPVRLRDITYAGKTTPNILRELCAYAGVGEAAIEECLPGMLSAFVQGVLGGMAENLRPNVLPGVPELLACLEQRGHRLGIVSGNPPQIGQEVLRRAGLLPHFSIFAFGPEARERWQLVALAIERAEAALGERLAPQRVVVVGDTPYDVAAGKACGARTVLVGTGVYERAELEAAGADLLLADFSDAGAACERLAGLAGG